MAFYNYAFEGSLDAPDGEMGALEFNAYDACATLEEIIPCESFHPDPYPHFDDDNMVRRKTDEECFEAKSTIWDHEIVFDVRGNPFRNAAVKLSEFAAKIQAAAAAMEAKAVELDSEIAEGREGGAV
jgi:hypothetical protein